IRLGKLALFRVVSKCGGIELKPCVIIGARLKGADRVALRNRSVAKGLIGKVYRHAIQQPHRFELSLGCYLASCRMVTVRPGRYSLVRCRVVGYELLGGVCKFTAYPTTTGFRVTDQLNSHRLAGIRWNNDDRGAGQLLVFGADQPGVTGVEVNPGLVSKGLIVVGCNTGIC